MKLIGNLGELLFLLSNSERGHTAEKWRVRRDLNLVDRGSTRFSTFGFPSPVKSFSPGPLPSPPLYLAELRTHQEQREAPAPKIKYCVRLRSVLLSGLADQLEELFSCQASLFDDSEQSASVEFWMKWDGYASTICVPRNSVFLLSGHSKTDCEQCID